MKAKIFLLIAIVFFLVNTLSAQKKLDTSVITYLNMITEEELSAHLHFLASDEMMGRKSAAASERLAAKYLADHYVNTGISAMKDTKVVDRYFQPFTFTIGKNTYASQNVIAFIEGNDPKVKNEVIVLAAHYDHIGVGAKVENDSIYNGAADDGSGTVVLMELAESFQAAKNAGAKFGRSILILHTGAEEMGLRGSHYFVQQNPAVPLDRIKAVINMDGVGGTDKPQAANAWNYVYLLVNDSTSVGLNDLARKTNASTVNLDVLVPNNPQNYNSDNKPFEHELIPTLYFSSGLTEHYHKPSDGPSTINYAHMTKIAKLVFAVAWNLTNVPSIQDSRSLYSKTGDYFCPPCGCASDGKVFTAPGICPDCGMEVNPKWSKK